MRISSRTAVSPRGCGPAGRLARHRFLAVALLLWLGSALVASAASARILKVLPHYLDTDGRHSLSPSLYERDAYQARLRQHPELRAGLRFDVHWKAKRRGAESLILRLELRRSGGADLVTIERPVRAGRFFGTWSSLPLTREMYDQFGELIAWRATLWQGDQLLDEKKSFLW